MIAIGCWQFKCDFWNCILPVLFKREILSARECVFPKVLQLDKPWLFHMALLICFAHYVLSQIFFSVDARFSLYKKKKRAEKYFLKKNRCILKGFGVNMENVSLCLDLQNWIPTGLGFSWDACRLEEMQMLYVLLSVRFAHWSLLGLAALVCPQWLTSWGYFAVHLSSPCSPPHPSLVFKNSFECWFHLEYFLQLLCLGIICKCFVFFLTSH